MGCYLPPVSEPDDLAPIFGPGLCKLKRGSVDGFVLGWGERIQCGTTSGGVVKILNVM